MDTHVFMPLEVYKLMGAMGAINNKFDHTYVITYYVKMTSILSPTEARTNLYKLITEVNESHIPICIHGKHESAVLIAEEDWLAIEETIYLMSIPNMYKSIKEGMNTPIDECEKELDW